MKKYITIIIAVIALAVGFVAGRFQASNSSEKIYTHLFYQRTAGDARAYADVLTDLRNGREAEAMSKLERGVSYCVFPLEHLSASQRAEFQKQIDEVRVYRTKYPWQESSPQIDEGVQRVLASAK
jgi:hypothetical protein